MSDKTPEEKLTHHLKLESIFKIIKINKAIRGANKNITKTS